MNIKRGMTNKQVHEMRKKTEPGSMGNDSVRLPRKWTEAQDDAYDKAHGIKENSAQDKALDAKRGLMKKTKAKKKAKTFTIKHTGSFDGKSNALGHGGRAAQLKAQGASGALIGYLAHEAHAAPGEANYHGHKKGRK